MINDPKSEYWFWGCSGLIFLACMIADTALVEIYQGGIFGRGFVSVAETLGGSIGFWLVGGIVSGIFYLGKKPSRTFLLKLWIVGSTIMFLFKGVGLSHDMRFNLLWLVIVILFVRPRETQTINLDAGRVKSKDYKSFSAGRPQANIVNQIKTSPQEKPLGVKDGLLTKGQLGKILKILKESVSSTGSKTAAGANYTNSIENDWSEEFKILYEYDLEVKSCHDDLIRIDPKMAKNFREEVQKDRKQAKFIRDKLMIEREKVLTPYQRKDLNDALAKARSIDPNAVAEEEFKKIVEVLGEDIDIPSVLDHLREKHLKKYMP